jgi:tRNA A22 N-methylase
MMTDQQQHLATYLVRQGFNNLNNEEVQKLISGMTAQAITEALEDARKQIDKLKQTGLGRELI